MNAKEKVDGLWKYEVYEWKYICPIVFKMCAIKTIFKADLMFVVLVRYY